MSDKLFGWLTPTGRFVECPLLQHLEIAGKDEEFLKVPGIRELVDQVQGCYSSCVELEEREGSCNAEWHSYEMAREDAIPEMWQRLLEASFIRVGSPAAGAAVCFEGMPDVLKSRYHACRSLAEEHDRECRFEPQQLKRQYT